MQKVKLWFLVILMASIVGCVLKIQTEIICTQDGKEVPCPDPTTPVPAEPTLTISQVATAGGLVFAEEQGVRFTIFTLTANGGDIPVRSVTAERVGKGMTRASPAWNSR